MSFHYSISAQRVQGFIWQLSRGKVITWSDDSIQTNPSYSSATVKTSLDMIILIFVFR